MLNCGIYAGSRWEHEIERNKVVCQYSSLRGKMFDQLLMRWRRCLGFGTLRFGPWLWCSQLTSETYEIESAVLSQV